MTKLASLPLYATDEEIAKAVLGKKAGMWKALATAWQHDPRWPPVDRLTGCRYVPAVQRFFDTIHGLAEVGTAPGGRDEGREDWAAWGRKSTRRGSRPPA